MSEEKDQTKSVKSSSGMTAAEVEEMEREAGAPDEATTLGSGG
jgi:hypothetical protein